LSGHTEKDGGTNMKVQIVQWGEEKAVLKREIEQNRNKEGR
jgi:hypothetical protein